MKYLAILTFLVLSNLVTAQESPALCNPDQFPNSIVEEMPKPTISSDELDERLKKLTFYQNGVNRKLFGGYWFQLKINCKGELSAVKSMRMAGRALESHSNAIIAELKKLEWTPGKNGSEAVDVMLIWEFGVNPAGLVSPKY